MIKKLRIKERDIQRQMEKNRIRDAKYNMRCNRR